METRLASVADAAALAALHGESFGDARWSEAQITDSLSLATTRAWIAQENAAPQGFIMLQIAGSEAEILTFCVAPAARRAGAGRRLLQTALAAARAEKAARLFLEVAADNRAALALYEQSGFAAAGKRAGYYRRGARGVDAVMLALDL